MREVFKKTEISVQQKQKLLTVLNETDHFPYFTELHLADIYVKSIYQFMSVVTSKKESIYFFAVPNHRSFNRMREHIGRSARLPNNSPVHDKLVSAVALNNYPRRGRFGKMVDVYVVLSRSPQDKRAGKNKYGYTHRLTQGVILGKLRASVARNQSDALRQIRAVPQRIR